MRKLLVLALITALMICAVPVSGYEITDYGAGLYYVHCGQWGGAGDCAAGIISAIQNRTVISMAPYDNELSGGTSGFFILTRGNKE